MVLADIEKRLCPTTYQVAVGEEIFGNATDFVEYIVGSIDAHKTLEIVAEMLYNGATKDPKNSRTIALMCEELVLQIVEYRELKERDGLARTVEEYIAKDAVHDFKCAWNQSLILAFRGRLPAGGSPVESGSPASDCDSCNADWDSEERKKSLLCASIYVADLYSVAIIPFHSLWECIRVLVKRLARYEHLVILLTILGRAFSYRGSKPPTWFGKELVEIVRKRCKDVFYELDKLEEEMVLEHFLDRHGLLEGNSEEYQASFGRPFWTEEETVARHVENTSEEYDIGSMLINGKDYLENYRQMKFYDLRERATKQVPKVFAVDRANTRKAEIVEIIEVSELELDEIFEEEGRLEGLRLRRFD